MRVFVVDRAEHFSWLGAGPFVVAEVIAESLGADPFRETLTDAELEDRYPGLLEAWRRGDESSFERADALLELDLEADEASGLA